MNRSILAIGAFVCALTQSQAQLFWVNEFHYDNSGTDVGEFIEIAASSSFTDLSTVTLTLYRGSDGTSYGTHKLSTFTVGSTSGSYTLYSKSISGIQNGAPDGFALDRSGSLVQFLSYEGIFQATSGSASGQTSTDIGIAESSATSLGASLGLTGSGQGFSEFTWTTFTDDTPGSLNSSQSFSAAPEPSQYAFIAAFCLVGYAMVRRSQRH